MTHYCYFFIHGNEYILRSLKVYSFFTDEETWRLVVVSSESLEQNVVFAHVNVGLAVLGDSVGTGVSGAAFTDPAVFAERVTVDEKEGGAFEILYETS